MVLDLSIAAGPEKEGAGGSHLFLPCERLSSLMGIDRWRLRRGPPLAPETERREERKGRREEKRKQEWKGKVCSAVKAGGKKEGAEKSGRGGERAGK